MKTLWEAGITRVLCGDNVILARKHWEGLAERRDRAEKKYGRDSPRIPQCRFDTTRPRLLGAMWRLSRNKLLTPWEARNTTLAIARCLPNNASKSIDLLIPSFQVGLINGEPLVDYGDPRFDTIARKWKTMRGNPKLYEHEMLVEILALLCGGRSCLTKLKKSAPSVMLAS